MPQCSRPVCHPGPMVGPVDGADQRWTRTSRRCGSLDPGHGRPPGRAGCRPGAGPGWPRPGGPRSPPGRPRRAGPAARARPWPRPTISGQRANSRPSPSAPSQPEPPGHRVQRAVEPAGAPSPGGRWGSGLTGAPRSADHVAALDHGVDLGRGDLRRGRQGRGQQGLARRAGRPGGPWPGAGRARRTRRRGGAPGPCRAARWPAGGRPGAGPAPATAARPGRRGCAPGSPPSGELELVAVGPDRRDAPLEVLGRGLRPGRRAARPSHERRYVERRRRWSLTGQARVVRGGQRGQLADQRLPGLDQARCPTSSSRASHTSRVAAISASSVRPDVAQQRRPLAQDLLDLLGGSRRLRVDHGQGLVEEPPPVGRARPGPRRCPRARTP